MFTQLPGNGCGPGVEPRAAEDASVSRGFTVPNRERRRKRCLYGPLYVFGPENTSGTQTNGGPTWQRKHVIGSIRTRASASVASRTCAATGAAAGKAGRSQSN